MNNTYEKPLFNSFSHMLFIVFVSFKGFYLFIFLISVFYISSVFTYYNNLHLEPQWFFYISTFISTFLPYFLLYSAVINAPLPFPAWIMINLSDQLLIRRFLLGTCIWMVEFRVGILTGADLFPLYISSVCGVRLDSRYPCHFLILLLCSHRH